MICLVVDGIICRFLNIQLKLEKCQIKKLKKKHRVYLISQIRLILYKLKVKHEQFVYH